MRASNPYIVGLTGGIASGKTSVSEVIEAEGVPVIDADRISRALTEPSGEALPKIREAFGDEVFGPDGSLDRAKLGDWVFHDEAKRRALEHILHPMIQKRMMDAVDRQREDGAPLCVLSVPLLFETGMDALCDEVWVITLEPETQIARLIQRDRIPRLSAMARIDAQMPKQEREQRADVLIKNDRSEQDLQRDVKARLSELQTRLGTKPKG